MKLTKTLLTVAGATLFTASVQAQVMTEVRISTAGVDEEYVEIQGTAGQSTDGLMLLVVEGDPGGATGGAGTLDRAYDLVGDTFPDAFYVVGSSQAAGNMTWGTEIDNTTFGDNMFENSSLTLYLVSVPDANKRADITGSWVGTDITDPMGSLTTRIFTDPLVTILDAVAIWDGDMGDLFYDNAPEFGPDGTFLPSGVFRNGGCPGDWCHDEFLNFFVDGMPNPPYADPTPGTVNPMSMSCAIVTSIGNCVNAAGIGNNYGAANANSTGAIASIGATGSTTVSDNDVTLMAAGLPNNSFGFFLASRDAGFVANPAGSAGNLLLGGSIGRYVGAGQIQNSGATGGFDLGIDLTQVPQPTGFVAVSAGETWRFQAWYRDAVMGTPTSNFTDGVEIAFN